MKLHFHGADYERESLKLSAEDNLDNGKYRGLKTTIHHHSVKNRNSDPNKLMTYRGVPYIRR